MFKKLMLVLFICCVSVFAQGIDPAVNTGSVTPPTPVVVHTPEVTLPTAAGPVTVPSVPVTLPVDATPREEPYQFYSMGGGISAGSGAVERLAYWSTSQLITKGTYLTQIVEAGRDKEGKILTCFRAGISKNLWQYKALTIGIVGDAGACDSPSGNGATGALGERGFGTYQIAKSNWFFVGTVEGVKINGAGTQGQTTQISFGFGYGLFKGK